MRCIIQYMFLVISCQYSLAGAYTSGFYTDSIYGQTVLVNRLPGEHRRAIKREILTLLGLHHRPRPVEHGKHNSAPNYMLDLYKTLNIDDEENGSDKEDAIPLVVKERLVSHNLTLPGMEERAGGADMIASFINHGKCKYQHIWRSYIRLIEARLSIWPSYNYILPSVPGICI